jgi:hypothetical protein
MTMAAGALFLVYVTTNQVLGIHLLGLDGKTSLLQPLDLVEFALEITGRSKFMTDFGADLFIRMNLAVWTNARDFQTSVSSQNYDEIMSATERAV